MNIKDLFSEGDEYVPMYHRGLIDEITNDSADGQLYYIRYASKHGGEIWQPVGLLMVEDQLYVYDDTRWKELSDIRTHKLEERIQNEFKANWAYLCEHIYLGDPHWHPITIVNNTFTSTKTIPANYGNRKNITYDYTFCFSTNTMHTFLSSTGMPYATNPAVILENGGYQPVAAYNLTKTKASTINEDLSVPIPDR